ncbi:hypothetical protein C8P68_11116 [Mucilaginibacter yixingensis]|uniref:MFS transporter n=1 Tax=Mucilaginibacter yixingensis TaxID=1295612 RepID=A0A2T5J4Q3_9SPHI|nr:DUF5690 family protein [Mucilaginibacter yixingensis]PTQ92639.1 hypothetical protein C8P68_11116 [Mucilaginibacter yixingensis]
MQFKEKLRTRVAQWHYSGLTIMAAIASFGTYTCMYSMRKAFTAATFSGHEYWHIDYKVWLVIVQVLGYTISKFYGIRYVAEVKQANRGRSILLFIGVAWLALLGFALVPPPYNIIFLFINGLPLGMIWGLVFGYIEGRRSTEFMAAVMAISLIFASGFVKFVGRTLMNVFHVSEFYMPFLTGALFVLPLVVFMFCLEIMPPPNDEDKRLRTERAPMSAEERRQFVIRFFPGILLAVITYLMLNIMRDVRDNFEVEIWAGMGIKTPSLYASIDSIIAVTVLVALGLLILVKRNLLAFSIIHIMMIAGFVMVGVGTVLYNNHQISPVTWMTIAGLGLYMGYVPYNSVFFDRMIAAFNYRSNVGFLICIADAIGYLGSVAVLLAKELGISSISWLNFFNAGTIVVAVVGGVAAVLSLIYFLQNANATRSDKSTAQTTTNQPASVEMI